MPKIVSTEAALYNGISQQSPELRLPSQLEDAVNTNLTLPRGIEKRPPAEIVKEFSGSFTTDSLVHPIEFSSDTQYLILIGGTDSTESDRIVDQEGTEYPIVFQDASASNYLKTAGDDGFNPSKDLKMTSILDYTFVTNRNVDVGMDASTAPDPLELAAYWWITNGVQQVERYGTFVARTATDHPTVGTYTVTADGRKLSDNDSYDAKKEFLTGNGTTGFNPSCITNTGAYVTGHMRNQEATGEEFQYPFGKIYVTDLGISDHNTANPNDPLVRVDASTTDTYGNTTIKSVGFHAVPEDTLPPRGVDGDVIRVASSESADADYYLQYNFETKSWSEVSAPEEPTTLLASTMPHAFIRKIDIDGTVTGTPDQIYFSFERIDWVARQTGDNNSAPLPSFVGKPIKDIFYFKSRLGFISGDNVILSATDDIFRFFPTTVKEVLDDDPIDITISSTNSVNLHHVAVFPESLIIIGDTGQFSLSSGGKAFTPENVLLDPTTSYSAKDDVIPVSVGSTLYFIAPHSSYAAVREYSVQPDTLITDAADVTAHVPQLIPNNIKQLVSENNLEYLFLIPEQEYSSEGNTIYVYKFYWQGNEKVQSSWQKWDFWSNPLGGATFNGQLYLLNNESVDGDQRSILTKLNLSDRPPVVLDESGDDFKSTRPNIDRVTNIAGPAVENDDLLFIEVTEEQYNYLDIDDAEPVLVDRQTGIAYTFLSRFQDVGGDYYIVVQLPDYLIPDGLGYTNNLMGSYTLGGGMIPPVDEDVIFPLEFPITLT